MIFLPQKLRNVETCLMAGAIAQIVLCVKNTQKRDLHAADANQLFILLVVRFVWRVAQTQELNVGETGRSLFERSN